MTIAGDLEAMVKIHADVTPAIADRIVQEFFNFLRDGNTISFLIGEVGEVKTGAYLECITALAIKCGHTRGPLG